MFREIKRRLVSVAASSVAAAVLALAVHPAAHAVPVTYTFVGTADFGSSLNLGGGAVDISGAAFTITGLTLSDTDTHPNPVVGAYAARSTYAFAGIGAFVTDASTGETYVQDCLDDVSFRCVALTDSNFLSGFLADFLPVTLADPNLGAVPVGGPFVPGSINSVTRTLTNLAGDTLILDVASIASVTVTAAQVGEPATLALFGIGLAGLGLMRRRRAA